MRTYQIKSLVFDPPEDGVYEPIILDGWRVVAILKSEEKVMAYGSKWYIKCLVEVEW